MMQVEQKEAIRIVGPATVQVTKGKSMHGAKRKKPTVGHVETMLANVWRAHPNMRSKIKGEPKADGDRHFVQLTTNWCAIKNGEHSGKQTRVCVTPHSVTQSCLSATCKARLQGKPSMQLWAKKAESAEEKQDKIDGLLASAGPDFDPRLAHSLHLADELALVAYVNRYFVKIVGMGGEPFVFQLYSSGKHVQRTVKQLLSAYEQFSIRVGKKQVSFMRTWSQHPDQATKERVIFDPNPATADPRDFNLWSGFAVTPEQAVVEVAGRDSAELCRPFLDHILNEWCAGNMPVFTYVMSWFARLRQKPWQKACTTILLCSKQGSGKTMVLDIMGKLLGSKYFLTVASMDTICGQYTMDALATSLLVNLDEALFSGNKAQAQQFKTLVTANKRIHNQKYEKTIELPDLSNYIITTNMANAVRVEENDRRTLCLQGASLYSGVPDEKAKAHFDRIASVNPAWLAHHLDNLDIRTFVPSMVPWTSYKAEQMRRALEPTTEWLEAQLGEHETMFTSEERLHTRETMYNAFKQHHGNSMHIPAKSIFWSELKAILNIREGQRTSTARMYLIPSKQRARELFIAKMGASIWDFH